MDSLASACIAIVVAVLVALTGTPSTLAAQDTTPPTITLDRPTGAHFTTPALAIAITGCDSQSAVTDAILTLNNGGLEYDTAGSSWQCNGYSEIFTTTVTLNPGSNSFRAVVCDLYGNCATRTATYYLDQSYGISVTPDGGSAGTLAAGASTQLHFTAHNNGTAAGSVNLAATCSGAVQSCALAGAASVTLAAGASTDVPVDVTAGSTAGTIVVSASATFAASPGTSDGGSQTLTVTAPPAPVPASVSVTLSPSMVAVGEYSTATATVRDADGQVMSGQGVSWQASPGGVVSVTSTGATTAQLSALAAGQATVTATTGNSIAGSAGITVQPAVQPTVAVAVHGLNPGAAIARDQCLTIAVGGDAAAECGDLRLAHPLPATRSLNVTRSPTLVYGSAHAKPGALVAADVTPQDFAPTSVTATLQIPGRTAVQRTYGWSACGGGGCRIVVPVDAAALGLGSGVYSYIFSVSATDGSTTRQASAVDSLVVVDRTVSPFGAGWWLDGLEQLVAAGSSAQLWIGGDGSTRLYRQVGSSNVFLATPVVDRPDTLLRVSTSEWRRQLRGHAYVQFDGGGRHVRTVDRYGRATEFWHSTVLGASRLDSIGLAVPAGSATTLRYRFGYDVSSGRSLLSSVTAPGRAAGSNTTQLVIAASGAVTRITDPDQHWIGLAYDAGGRPSARRNRRGDSTFFAWDEAGLLRQATVAMAGGAPSPVTTLCHAYGASLTACAGGAASGRPSSTVRTLLDGPRTDVADTTAFSLDGRGAPVRITNALGQVTIITRADSRFPALVTRLQRPNGFVTTAAYDGGGRLQTTSDLSPHGAGSGTATTTYGWNTTWDRVASVTPPAGPATTMTYDAVTGDLATQQTGPDASRQVSYRYHTGALAGLPRAVVVGGVVRDSMEYAPATGNLAATITALGHRTTMAQDGAGRDTLVVRPVQGGATPLVQQERRVYDAADRVTQAVASAPSVPYTLRALTPDTATVPALTLTTNQEYDAEGLPVHTSSYSSGDSDVTMDVTYTYDAAGRLTHRSHGAGPRWFVYDAAGNAVRTVTALGDTAVQSFDALDRLMRRVTPSRHYAQQGCTGLPAGPITGAGSGCFVVWPYYPNDGGTGYTVSGDTSTFVYDVAGNVIQADNRHARIRRGYFPNGQLDTDTTRLGSYGSPRLDADIRGQRYGYDLAGRPLTMVWERGTTSFGYADTDQGQPNRVTDPSGNVYRWEYSALGQPTRFTAAPASAPTVIGIDETRGYDADGQLAWRWRKSKKDSTWAVALDSLWYDARGKVVDVAVGSRASGSERVRLAYDGLGAITAQERTRNLGAQYDAEEFRNDAFGNVLYSRTRSSAWGEGIPQLSTYGLDGQLFGRHGVLPSPLPQGAVQEELDQGFDGAGAVRVSSLLRSDPNLPAWRDQTASRPYYDGDGRLAVVQRYAWHASGSSGTSDGAWEEYRYDALGRRVMTRVRRPDGDAPTGTNPLCSSIVSGVCSSYYERTWWAGQQILAEWRTADGTPNPTNSGTVGYVHAPGVKGIDAPVAVITTGGASAGTRVITEDWRGMGEASLFPNGAPADNTLYGGTAITVAWPSGRGAYFTPYLGQPSGSSVESTWLGSLVEHGAGAAGLLYRRNRYYDPQTGRFTQQDPIGIAGGVNVYGFAAGDPVNYSDPFGLSPEDVFVGCRDVDGSGGAGQHCAVRVVNDRTDVTFELLKKSGRNSIGPAPTDQIARYDGRWVQVAVPIGMTSAEFDAAVVGNAQSIGAERQGATYSPFGGRNSNRYIYDVVTRSGGRVPWAAQNPLRGPAPGLCGGSGISPGKDCAGVPTPNKKPTLNHVGQ